MRFAWVLAAALATGLPVAVGAQEKPAAACGATDASLPADLAGWVGKAALPSAAKAGDLSHATLTLGRAVLGDLHPTREVAYLVQPEKPGGSVAKGGLFAFDADRAGTYRVALDSGAWIDVLKGGAALVSTAHGRGPDCSTIRKMVDFSLQPGRYVIQVSANAEPKLAIMVSRRP